jgi:beta-galactosidase
MDYRKILVILLALFFFGIQKSQASKNDILSLDGEWEIIFDHNNEGNKAKYYLSEVFLQQQNIRKIKVPSAWETIEKDYEGAAFYRTTFSIDENWKNKVIRLQFGAVNYIAEVYLNDEVIGFHEGGFTPFEFRVDEMLKFGEENVLTLRVQGPIILSDKNVDGIGPLETPQWRGGITGGIWQSVNLVATGVVIIDDVFLIPNIHDNTVKLDITLDHTGIKNLTAPFTVEIFKKGTDDKLVETGNWALDPGINKESLTIHIPDATYWSPHNPVLYTAKVSVDVEDSVSDNWSENFGLRELTIRNKDFYLNGKPIFIKATFFEGLYPNGIAYPDSEEMARKEIQLAKEAGFNLIRPWRRPPVPMWLDLADEMGVLVVASPVLECMTLPFSTPYLPFRVENEIRETVLRDRNRACIIQWELFNELHRPILMQKMHSMAMITRELDPTRLILDESGGWAYGANMYLPYEKEPTKFNDIHNYPGPFINKRTYDGYLSIGMTKEEKEKNELYGPTPGRNVVPGLMAYISELGYGSLPDLTLNNKLFEEKGNELLPAYRYHKMLEEEQTKMLKESGFAYLYPDMQQFYLEQQHIHGTANKRMIEAARANPEVDGYCVHALCAGDWIMGAGLIDLWRNPKTYAFEATKAANQPRIISIRTTPRNVYSEKGLSLSVIGINEMDDVESVVSIEVSASNGEVVYSKTLNSKWAGGVSDLFETRLESKTWKGTYKVKIKVTTKAGELLTENERTFFVFTPDELKVPKTKVAVADMSGRMSNFLKNNGIKYRNFDKKAKEDVAVLVSGYDPWVKDLNNESVEQLFKFAEKGGTIVFVDELRDEILEKAPAMPFEIDVHASMGLWTCMPHLVREHPLFKGLPSDSAMRDLYENIWASNTLLEIKNVDGDLKPIVATVGFDWFSADHEMHYSGPGKSWWGSDVIELPYGKGRVIFSQLRIKDYLGKDPVADRYLYNLIEYTSSK